MQSDQSSDRSQIEPFASLVNTVRSTVPRLLLNRHAVGPFQKVPLRRGDYMELGDLEVTVRTFTELLGWRDEIEALMRSGETQVGTTQRKEHHGTICARLVSLHPASLLQSVPALISGELAPGQTRAAGAGSGGEETDSETDSKSSASSSPSN